MQKALPKKDPVSNPTRKPASNGAAKKQVGEGGKVRYSYPSEKKKKPAAGSKAGEAPKKVAVIVPVAPGPLPVDGKKFADQLGVAHHKVKEIAQRFHENHRLRGAEGFADFMHSNLHEFVAKHGLTKEYFHRLHAHLVSKK